MKDLKEVIEERKGIEKLSCAHFTVKQKNKQETVRSSSTVEELNFVGCSGQSDFGAVPCKFIETRGKSMCSRQGCRLEIRLSVGNNVLLWCGRPSQKTFWQVRSTQIAFFRVELSYFKVSKYRVDAQLDDFAYR